MFSSFRHAMAWLHTWLGLVLGFVLMVVFFTGVLSVFDRELDRWAIPESRFHAQPLPSFDSVLMPVFASIQPNAQSLERLRGKVDGPLPAHFDTVRSWSVYTTHRDPVLGLWASYEVPGAITPETTSAWGGRTIDPRTGAALPEGPLKIGSGFFFGLHYSLRIGWMNLGEWIVGLSALVMLAALVSGVVMHRKMWREFFTFRPRKHLQRSALDLHNLTGVLALPFLFFFAFTGLVIFTHIYFPVSHTQLKPLHDLHEQVEAQETGLPQKRAGIAVPLASVDAMVLEARRRWAAKSAPGEVGWLVLRHVHDANGTVSISRAGTDRIALVGDRIVFKASTGEVLHEEPGRSAVDSVHGFLNGLHLQHFRHWLLRWLYVLGGLMGGVCIGTGFVFFVEKRKRQHAKTGSQGSRIVDALAVTTITGMVVATLAILIANRLLPEGPAKGDWEQSSFWAAWLLALGHAGWRSAPVAQGKRNPAWREQCAAIAVMAVTAVGLNWLTTGDHLLKTVFADTYWPVAGVDLSLLASAALAAWVARRLNKPQAQPVRAKSRRVEPANA